MFINNKFKFSLCLSVVVSSLSINQASYAQFKVRKDSLEKSTWYTAPRQIQITSDDIYVAEGSQKLPDAVIRTDLSKNVVSPNSETIATITIFGRPWNDMLNVVLVKDGKNINLIR